MYESRNVFADIVSFNFPFFKSNCVVISLYVWPSLLSLKLVCRLALMHAKTKRQWKLRLGDETSAHNKEQTMDNLNADTTSMLPFTSFFLSFHFNASNIWLSLAYHGLYVAIVVIRLFVHFPFPSSLQCLMSSTDKLKTRIKHQPTNGT